MRTLFFAGNSSRLPYKPAFASLYIAFVSAGIFFLFRNWAYDDPFITYRYAQNIVNGLGFVYNPGERVLSTTTPFFTLLLAALALLSNNLPRLANLISAFSIALGALLLYALADSLHKPVVGWAGLLLYPTSPLLLNCIGSETPLYIAFCLGAFVFYFRSKYIFTAIFSALAVLTRPDGALVPILLAVDYLLRIRQPIPWKSVFLFFGLALPWYIFAWLYFGSPIPATLAAKQYQGLMMISQSFAAGSLTIIKTHYRLWFYMIQAVLALIGVLYIIFCARRWIIFIAWPVLYFYAYKLLGLTRYYWYYAPLLPGFIVLVGLGITGVELIVKQWLAKSKKQGAFPGNDSRIFVIVVLILLSGLQIKQMIAASQIRDERDPLYKHVGKWLRNNTLQNSSIGTLEIGIIGYYAERRIIDFGGLIQPDIAARLSRDTFFEDAAYYAVEQYKPDYLLLHERNFPNLEREYVSNTCQFLHRFEGAKFGYYTNLIVYNCRQP